MVVPAIRLSLLFGVVTLYGVLRIVTGMWLPVTKFAEIRGQVLRPSSHVLERNSSVWVAGTNPQTDVSKDSQVHNEDERTGQELRLLMESRCGSPFILAPQRLTTAEGQFSDMNGYDLALVQVLTRHGDRAPLRGIPLANFSSFRCPSMNEYFSDIRVNEMSRCSRGRLTWKGCRQHEDLGRHLKTIYHLDPEEVGSSMTVITTDYQRSIQSAKCLLKGLLGHTQYRSVPKSQGTMFQDLSDDYTSNCRSVNDLRRQTELQPDFLQARVKWYETKAKLKQFLSQFNKKIKSHQGPIEFYEGLICHYCHVYGTGGSSSITPCIQNQCLPPSLVIPTIKASDMYTKLHNDENVAILQIQPFIARIVSNFKEWIEGRRRQRFVLFSGHDTTVTAVLSALHAFDGHRPPYAARVVFELWKKAGDEDDYVVRTLYNGRVINSDIISDAMSFRLFDKRLMTGRLRSKKSHGAACLEGRFGV